MKAEWSLFPVIEKWGTQEGFCAQEPHGVLLGFRLWPGLGFASADSPVLAPCLSRVAAVGTSKALCCDHCPPSNPDSKGMVSHKLDVSLHWPPAHQSPGQGSDSGLTFPGPHLPHWLHLLQLSPSARAAAPSLFLKHNIWACPMAFSWLTNTPPPDTHVTPSFASSGLYSKFSVRPSNQRD